MTLARIVGRSIGLGERGARRPAVPVLLLATLALCGCSGSGANATSPDVVASTDLGDVTKVELDEHIIALPEERRVPAEGQDPAAWRREVLEQMLLGRFLEEQARTKKLLETDEAKRTIEMQRELILQQEVEARMIRERVTVTEADLRAFYDANPDEVGHGEQLRLRHIYRRVDRDAPAEEREAVRAEMERILQQLRDGANFIEMAKQHSQSETAALGGLIGRVDRGKFSRQTDEIIWALGEGEISDIVSTPVGFHIFRVDDRLPAESREFDEVRGLLGRRLTHEGTLREKRAYFDELLTASGALYNPAGLGAADDATVLFELSGDGLTLAEWRQRFGNRPFHEQRTTSVREQLDEWVRARLYVWEAERAALAADPAIADKLKEMERGVAVGLALREEQRAAMDAIDESELREYYDANQRRFQTPRLIELRLITASHDDAKGRGLLSVYRKLDELADQIREGRVDFAEAAKRLSEDPSAAAGGYVGAIRMDSFSEWAGPVAQKTVVQLGVGEVSEPILIERYDRRNLNYDRAGYMLVRVEAIREPALQPFEDVRQEVEAQIAERRSAEIADQIADSALRAIHARIHAENL